MVGVLLRRNSEFRELLPPGLLWWPQSCVIACLLSNMLVPLPFVIGFVRMFFGFCIDSDSWLVWGHYRLILSWWLLGVSLSVKLRRLLGLSAVRVRVVWVQQPL